MQETINTDIAIIGAGLTGLALGHYLKKNGQNVRLIEKEGQVGGVIKTINENGFIFETGPNTGVLSNLEIVELFEELHPDCKLEQANPHAKKRLIRKNNQWHALPSNLSSAIKTPLFSIKDKLRIIGEPFRKKGTNEFESVADLTIRRLGKSYLDYAVDPFISGIYAGNPHLLTTKYALPKLYHLEQNYGSFIKGAIKKKLKLKAEKKQKVTREVFSVQNGLQNLINALENSIKKENIFLNCDNYKIKYEKENQFNIQLNEDNQKKIIKAKHVISTIGAYNLPEVFSFIDKKLTGIIAHLKYAKVIQAVVGFKNWNGIKLDAFGGLIPSIEKKKLLGILFPSSCFGGRCPEGGALLSVFMGGMQHPEIIEMTDSQISEIVIKNIAEIMQLKTSKPDLLKIFRYAHAIPQYEENTGERLQIIEQLEQKYVGLHLAGNIRNGIGMADRVKQACDIANFISNQTTSNIPKRD